MTNAYDIDPNRAQWKLVPMQMTTEMQCAAQNAALQNQTVDWVLKVWEASLAASPQPAQEPGEWQRGYNDAMTICADHMRRVKEALNKPLPAGWANHAHHLYRNVSEAIEEAHTQAVQEPFGYIVRSVKSVEQQRETFPGEEPDYLWKYIHGTSNLALYEDRIDLEVKRCYAAPTQAAAPEFDVRRILLDIVPGDGSGLEVYAKSVQDVERKLTEMGQRIEDLEAAAPSGELVEALRPFANTDLTNPIVRDTFGFDVLRARAALARYQEPKHDV